MIRVTSSSLLWRIQNDLSRDRNVVKALIRRSTYESLSQRLGWRQALSWGWEFKLRSTHIPQSGRIIGCSCYIKTTGFQNNEITYVNVCDALIILFSKHSTVGGTYPLLSLYIYLQFYSRFDNLCFIVLLLLQLPATTLRALAAWPCMKEMLQTSQMSNTL